jgi:alanyl-tRNA synthetase
MELLKINLQLFADDGNGDQEDPPVKTFTQDEVNAIIAERLNREGIHDQKEIVELLKDFGYDGTPAEIKVVLREQAKEYKAQQEQVSKRAELEELQEQARQNGTSPELLAEIKALKAEIANLKEKDEAAKRKHEEISAAEQRFNAEVNAFVEKYPDIDHDKLAKNEKFVKFYHRSDKSLTLTEVYEDFVDLISEAEKIAIEKVKSNIDRTTSSGKNRGPGADGGTYGLSARQMELADESGIPYKKYAAHMALIKK